MAKSMLLISRHSPWSGTCARETLDIALAGGAFDLPTAMLFLDDGVFQLAAQQNPVVLQQKDLGANLQALPLFGVDEIYVCGESLVRRGLDTDSLALPAQALDAAALAALVDRYDLVITL